MNCTICFVVLLLLFNLYFANGYKTKQNSGILTVPEPSAWGQKPYALGAIDGAQPIDTNLGNSGTWLTDNTEQGWKIRLQLLDAHNYVRMLEANHAPYMTKLIWDFHLEAYSRQWATFLCKNENSKFFEHSPNNVSGIPAWPYRMYYGENLYASTKIRQKTEVFTDVVLKWYKERDYYDWNTGNALPKYSSKPVGHWKQLVRPKATIVGCSVISDCHKKNANGWKTFVVCHYDYGNIGSQPYDPGNYNKCSNCPIGYNCCEKGLCSGYVPVDSKNFNEMVKPTTIKEEWHACKNNARPNCDEIGATTTISSLPIKTKLEYNNCYCGNNQLIDSFNDLVGQRLFFFRNQCYKGSALSSETNDDVNSIYLTKDKKIFNESNVETDIVENTENGSDLELPLVFSDNYIQNLLNSDPMSSTFSNDLSEVKKHNLKGYDNNIEEA